MSIDLRLGDWREVLADVECDALITDPPYSERTHGGHFSGCSDGTDPEWLARRGYDDKRARRRHIAYAAWTGDDMVSFVREWSARCRSWMVVITDHVLAEACADGAASSGRYVFAPIPFVEVGKCPRMNGDGPASWTCWVVASRPKEKRFAEWGSLPGAYVFRTGSVEQKKLVVGGKPMFLKQALVRDYSRPGDVVVDPCAGGATTLIAASGMGRHAIGAEIDPDTHAKAMERIDRGVQQEMFA